MYNQIIKQHAEANISVKRNKVKSYYNVVYLADKQEFEIELFNPTQTTKLAKISINGTPISTKGIVLKPGQRVYLERFIDNPKKFLFETYSVEGNNPEVQATIQKNGDIEVTFYDEQKPYEPPVYYNTSFYLNGTNTTGSFSSLTTTLTGGQNANLRSYKSTPTTESMSMFSLQETGRVEGGNSSNQKFTYYNGEFNSYSSNTVKIKILPLSAKPLEIKELAEYCIECGTKNKKGNYKYCPKCGHKF